MRASDAYPLRLAGRPVGAEVERLYRRHAAEVLRYARAVLRSGPDAEDATQATFVRALAALERGERVHTPGNWLIAIAHNECRRVLAGRKRRACEVELAECDAPAHAGENGRATELRRALEQLTPRQRRALVLRELEGRSYAQIAASLGLNESAVETLIFRARRAVREQLDANLDCEAAAGLIAASALTALDRKRLRAHARACAECATLERRARGRRGALGRLASSLGLPWGVKGLAVALTASAVVVATPVVGSRVGGEPRGHATPGVVAAPGAVAPRTALGTSAGTRPAAVREVVRRPAVVTHAARRSAAASVPAPPLPVPRTRTAPVPERAPVSEPAPQPDPVVADPGPAAAPAAEPQPPAAPVPAPAVSVELPAPLPSVAVSVPLALPPLPADLPPVLVGPVSVSVALPQEAVALPIVKLP